MYASYQLGRENARESWEKILVRVREGSVARLRVMRTVFATMMCMHMRIYFIHVCVSIYECMYVCVTVAGDSVDARTVIGSPRVSE